MSSEVVIQASALSKAYLIYAKPQDRLKQMFMRWRRYYREYWAVQNIDLSISRGQTVALVGRNGSGKSTLLQMIAGTLQPSAGSLNVSGRVAPLLELGVDEQSPGSLEELSRITGRSKPSLSRTLKTMVNYGLVRMDPGEGQKVVPKVLHDRVALELPLIERRAAKGSAL